MGASFPFDGPLAWCRLRHPGRENIQLTLIYLDNHKFTMRDIKILEAYYINELNNDFGIHHATIDRILDNLKFKLYDYFTFSTKILEGSDLDNFLSLNELIKLKDSINPKKPSRSNPVILKD